MGRQLVAAAFLLVVPLTGYAQQPDEDRRSIRVAAGIVSQQGTFGDDSPRTSRAEIGPTFSVAIRRHPAHRLGLAFEAALEPTAIQNPHFDEGVSRLYLQIGSEIGRRIYVRPMIGGSINAWSGQFSSSGFSLAPAVSVAAGYRHTMISGWSLHTEFVTRAATEVGAITRSIGIQIGVNPRGW